LASLSAEVGVSVNDSESLALLRAKDEIRQLAYRYAFAHDSRDAELLLSLWAETDEPLEYPYIDIHRVRRDTDHWFRKGPTTHIVANHLIDFDSLDAAHGSVYCLAQVDFGDRFVDQTILYRDQYVRLDERWLFRERMHLLWFGQGRERHPYRQDDAHWPKSQVGRGDAPASFPTYLATKNGDPWAWERRPGS
jgi:hypothetical protein